MIFPCPRIGLNLRPNSRAIAGFCRETRSIGTLGTFALLKARRRLLSSENSEPWWLTTRMGGKLSGLSLPDFSPAIASLTSPPLLKCGLTVGCVKRISLGFPTRRRASFLSLLASLPGLRRFLSDRSLPPIRLTLCTSTAGESAPAGDPARRRPAVPFRPGGRLPAGRRDRQDAADGLDRHSGSR